MTQVLADGYRRFAELEAAGVSAIYFDWATGVADDPAVLDLIAALPGTKRQPNLVFAAARFLGAPVDSYVDFRDWLIEHWDAAPPVIMAHSTQTNEAARFAVLLPVLEQPEHAERRDRLHRAAALVAADPPHLVAGDIIDEVPALIEQAPAGSQVVVFHSAMLVYLAEQRRAEFVRLMQSMDGVTWISNEGADVLPFITEQVDDEVRGRTILARDGEPVALVGPHGQSFQRLRDVPQDPSPAHPLTRSN